MAAAETVFRKANELGITLTVEGDFIAYSPKSKAPPEFVEELRRHKPEVIDHLRLLESTTDIDLPGVWIEAKAATEIICPACTMNRWKAPCRCVWADGRVWEDWWYECDGCGYWELRRRE
ncbi:hypothetical protein CMI37_28730 [Candidatus Pacearchaeota archaeon]|nr:hypothetical protein [Candidatus Pacearchaeota archaeon]